MAVTPEPTLASTALMTEDVPLFGNKSYGSGAAELGYDVAQGMGATMMRLHRGRDTSFSFAAHMDPFVADATRRGFQPYLTLTYRRRYRDQPDPGFLGLPTPQDFGAWCGQAAGRYSDSVFHYGVFNEPNYFGDGMTPQHYNALYRSCYTAIKQANPAANVYYGEIAADEYSGDPCSWVSQSLSSSSPTFADGIAIHTYQWTTPPEQPVTGVCRGIGRLGDWDSMTSFWQANNGSLKRPGGDPVPLVVSEHGYCAPHGECPATRGAVNRLPEATRADWASRAFTWAEQHDVDIFSYYHFFNQPDGPAVWDSGILRQDFTATPTVGALQSALGAAPGVTGWSPWETLGGGIATGTGPAVESRTSGTLDVFIHGVDNGLHQRWYAGSWSSWGGLGSTPIKGSPAAASWSPGRLDVVARAADDSLIQKIWVDPFGWSGWVNLGGQLKSSPAVTSWGPNRLDIFVRGADDAVWHRFYNGSWSGWSSLGGNITSAPSAVSWGANRIDLFARGANDELVHKFFEGGTWSGWESLGGTLTSAPSAASWAPNHLDVYVRGVDNALWHKWWDGTEWQSGFESLGGFLTGPPAAVSWGLGRMDVFAPGVDGELYHRFYE